MSGDLPAQLHQNVPSVVVLSTAASTDSPLDLHLGLDHVICVVSWYNPTTDRLF